MTHLNGKLEIEFVNPKSTGVVQFKDDLTQPGVDNIDIIVLGT